MKKRRKKIAIRYKLNPFFLSFFSLKMKDFKIVKIIRMAFFVADLIIDIILLICITENYIMSR